MGKRIKNRIADLLPGYGWACFFVLLLIQVLVFYATRIPLLRREPVDLSVAWDSLIPFRPEWIVVYVLSFASWGVTFLFLFRQRREQVYRNAAAYLVTLLVTGACYLLIPAAIERPEVTGSDFFSRLTRLVYALDPPNNLCPSLHVICSYYCWRCLYGAEGVPRWYRRFNLVYLALVCCAILLVKQHVLVDVPAGLLVSEIPLQLSKRFKWERLGSALEKRIQPRSRKVQ